MSSTTQRTPGEARDAAQREAARHPGEGGQPDGQASSPEQADSRHDPDFIEYEIEETFDRTVAEGRRRLGRRWAPLSATGIVGGIDVGTGVLGLLLVETATKSKLLAGLGFSVGFIALALARSELFTEDFLVPVTTVIARQAKVRSLVRLWGVTLVANLIGGWVITYLVIAGFPSLRKSAIEAGAFYVDLGIGWRAFALALLGGAAITLMTWMQHSTESLGLKVVPAITTAFLLAGGQLNHAIVNSLLMFSALHTGHAPFGYLQWAETAGWAALGNVVGGVGLVTLLRLLQIPHKVAEERSNPAEGVPMTKPAWRPAQRR
ncbi:MAG: formate/nitrite transporter family protein [Actinomycetota bacterium]|nr:formate/nitrite transporter family protein [Actinomycetota bacterium]